MSRYQEDKAKGAMMPAIAFTGGETAYEEWYNKETAGSPPTTAPGTYANHAIELSKTFQMNQGNVGTKPLSDAMQMDSDRSSMERLMGGSLLNSDGNPEGPGFAYFNHLFRRNGGETTLKQSKKDKMTKGGSNIYTEATEALKVAIKALGVASSMNPTGLPIDIRDAQKMWFGDEEDIDETKVQQWRTSTEMGDAAVDPKKTRKFTNYDGSLTWEILNDDKTVSSRFTIGEYAGVKVFSQGGYNKFTELLEKVKAQVGMDENTGFDAMRSKY